MRPLLELKKNYIVVGRGATAIYLVLDQFKNGEVILPANICYAAVYPVIFSGNIPKFCDVDPQNGNMTERYFKDAISAKTKAVVVPHMYGNPVSEIDKIREICHKKNIILIEDCASAMGAKIFEEQVGTFGDYVIYSTGYSKTIDFGNGGILCSNKPLDCMREKYELLPLYNITIAKQNELFSKIYRQIRNAKLEVECRGIFSVFENNCRDSYLYKIDKAEEEKILNGLDNLQFIIECRKVQREKYDELIKFDLPFMKRYIYEEGAVPWRYNFFVDSAYRKRLIDLLLENSIPVSDWYPRTSIIFGDDTVYPNAKWMEEQILNFPLMVPDEKIEHICKVVNECVGKLT